jgi:hypothetical protein
MGLLLGLMLVASVSVSVYAAAGTCADFLNSLARRESGLNPKVVNRYGYVGLFQMGEAALIDAGFYKADGTGRNDWRGSWTGASGVKSLDDFLNNPAAQVAAITAYHRRVEGYISSLGLARFEGSTVGGWPITHSGMVAAAHLVGAGNLAKFLTSGGSTVPRDGTGTPITEYLSKFGGYTLSGAGADCSAFASGVPTDGVKEVPPSASAPKPTPPPLPYPKAEVSPFPMDPADAFYSASGISMADNRLLIRSVSAGLALLLAMVVIVGCFTSYTRGYAALNTLKSVLTALMVLAMFMAFWVR